LPNSSRNSSAATNRPAATTGAPAASSRLPRGWACDLAQSSYCNRENKVALGFVEGFNNKIRVIQRRAYGLRDEEYLRLKILTCMLPEL
jgi:hypothetical protein